MNRNKSPLKDLAYSLVTTLAAGLVVAAVAGAGLYVMSRHQIPATSDRKTAPPDLRKENAPGGEARDRLAARRERARRQPQGVVIEEEEESTAKVEDSPTTAMAGGPTGPPPKAEDQADRPATEDREKAAR